MGYVIKSYETPDESLPMNSGLVIQIVLWLRVVEATSALLWFTLIDEILNTGDKGKKNSHSAKCSLFTFVLMILAQSLSLQKLKE